MIEAAVAILYTITVALKGPVVLAVLTALVWSLFATGGFLSEWIERRKQASKWNAQLHETSGKPATLAERLSLPFAPELVRATSVKDASSKASDVWLEAVEFEAARRLTRLRIGLRIGPVIGLMGTLIPMGPALMNISKGNLTVMSNDLIIAFSTTVAGLLVGALCYVMLIVRQYWYAKDMADLERLARTLKEDRHGA